MALIEMVGCDACTLKQEWRHLRHPVMNYSAPLIASTPRVLVLGNSPDDSEDELGIPFRNKAARFLRDHLLEDGKDSYYWANLTKCAPPKRKATAHEIECCSKGFLEQELLDINPHVILTVGEDALRYFCQEENLAVLRGLYIPYELADGGTCWIYPIYDPAVISRYGDPEARPGGDDYNSYYPVWRSDIEKFKKYCKTVFTERPRIYVAPKKEQIYYPKNKGEAEQLLAKMVMKPTIDIETSKKKPYMRNAKMLTAAISDGITTMSFPVEWPNTIPWGKEFLADYFARKYKWWQWKAHNAGFELVWFMSRFLETRFEFECTMTKARFLHDRTRILSLDTQSRIHLGTPIKSETDKGMLAALRRNDEAILGYPLDAILYYGGLDAWAQANLDNELDLPESQYENYARALDATESTVAMEFAGLPTDDAKTYELKRQLTDKMDAVEQKAWSFDECVSFERDYGKKVRLSAPDDVAIVIIRYLKKDLPQSSRNKYSTDEAALNEVGGRFVDAVLEYREYAKQDSTYVDPIISGQVVGVDGAVHAGYSVVLTATGRLSSMDPNIQNFPKRKNKEVREQFVPPPGMIMAAFDYGQLEARVIAMASRDKNLSQSIIKKVDIHYKWLDVLLNRYPGYYDRLRKKTGKQDEKSLRKAGRDTIKTDFVFASFYGSRTYSIAKRTDIPQEIVDEVQGSFWREYNGVHTWQKGMFDEYVNTGAVHTLTEMYRNEVVGGNEPINTPTQGTAAHLVIEAQNALYQMSRARKDPFLMPRINIHDDLLFFFPDDNRLEEYIVTVGTEIVRPRFWFNNVPLMTECRVGYNWANLEVVTEFIGDYHA